MKRTEWLIEQDSRGNFEVSQGNRLLKVDLTTLQVAIKAVIDKGWEDGQKVFLLEPDGLRTNVTQTVVKKKTAWQTP